MSIKMFNPPQQRRQRGYGLVEVMISLVIIAILVAIAVALSINLRTSSSITANTQHITQIAANAKKSFGVTNQYSAVQQVRAVNALVPRELRTFNPATQQYTSTAFNTFGGELLFGFSYLTSIGDTMVFVWQKVPKEQCEQIVTQTAGLMRRVEIQHGAAGTPITPYTSATLPGVLAQAGSLDAAVATVTQITASTLSGDGGAPESKLVKATDRELSTGALNDMCNAGADNVNIWFWVGRS